MELELPEISVEVPTPQQVAMGAARSVAESLKRTIRAGQDATGAPVRPPKQSTLDRRARDEYAPAKPRTDRWPTRYPGRARRLASGAATRGRMLWQATKWSQRSGWRQTTRFKASHVSRLPLVDSGILWQRIRAAAAGSGSAVVESPDRPVGAIESRVGAQIFTATPAMLEAAVDDAMADTFAGWSGASGASATASLRRALA